MNPCDISFRSEEAGDGVSAEAVLAGTLCLMSCAMQSGSTRYLAKIVDNLDVLAACPELSREMRCVCRRLAGHWQCAPDGTPLENLTKSAGVH
ncbi:MAG: hypothetical protein JNN20_19785 [Betaproteobacteria bacterium]|nr:hypothetical protein [Betaproteobacteria bacterium]